ncbi:MAG: class I SAM-dependent methyltransferase [Sandaracinaceae bacterium]
MRLEIRPTLALGLFATWLGACGSAPPRPSEPNDYRTASVALRRDGRAAAEVARAPWVRAWAEAAVSLDVPSEATLAAGSETLPGYLGYDDGGSPLSYTRALDVLAAAGLAPDDGTRVVDFGSGGHAQLELWSAIGARGIGIEVRDVFAARQRLSPHPDRSEMRIGRFPTEVTLEPDSVDLFIAKNVLKNGYIHPPAGTDPRMAIDLGVSDEAFVAALARAVRPGGWVLLYNIMPPPNGPGLPYRTWADGRCPFSRETWTAGGFEVVAFDVDDTEATRELARALMWDDPDTFFAMYTLLRRVEPEPT